MYKFREEGMPDVYCDFIALHGLRIQAVSLMGTEIAIKAYRAKFLDSSLSRIESHFNLYDPETDRQISRAIKPIGNFKTLPQIKHDQALQVVMLKEDLLWGTSHDDLLVRLYQHLTNELCIPTPTPNEPEYLECMERILSYGVDCSYLTELRVLGIQVECYLINSYYTEDYTDGVEEIISSYLVESLAPSKLMEGIGGVADYIQRYALPIGEKVGERVTYLHQPGEYDPEVFNEFKKTPFPQQKDIAAAASKRLDVANNVIISGEMGTGKTLIGITTCHYHSKRKPYRTIVTCPGHLVEKWAREIKETLPDVDVFAFLGEDELPWKQFLHRYQNSGSLSKPEFWIVSNETLRGGYILKPGYVSRQRNAWDIENGKDVLVPELSCPRCGKLLQIPRKDESGDTYWEDMTPADFNTHNKQNHCCRNSVIDPVTKEEKMCGEMLWQADNQRAGYRKISVADIIKKRIPKGFFDYFIADEAHKFKGTTAQGLAFGGVISKVNKVIAMTGTLGDGYAHGLYYILWRMEPKMFKSKGYNHDEKSRTKFQNEYGFWQKKQKISSSDQYGRTSRARNSKVSVKSLPGYTINTFPEWLIERTCFLKLSDVAPYLPPMKEYVNVVEMDAELQKNYSEIENRLRGEIRKGGNQIASIMLHTCLSYPDLAEGPEVIQIEKPKYTFSMTVPSLDPTKLYNKERELQTIIEAELKLGRKCMVFTTYTGKRDCIPRLEWVIEQVPSANIQVLRSTTVSTKKRERYVKDKLNSEGKNVLICNSELVETGLDLLECPTIIWVQSGYISTTVRQASRRSWRIGQEKEVKVIFLCYKNTYQESCFQLIGGKLNAAGVLEGNLSNEGLRNFGQEANSFNDILALLRDNIITKNSNDIFDRYKAEVAELLSKPMLRVEEIIRLKTLKEILVENQVDLTGLTSRQKKKILAQENQFVLFA